jgi:hypothetical protein
MSLLNVKVFLWTKIQECVTFKEKYHIETHKSKVLLLLVWKSETNKDNFN